MLNIGICFGYCGNITVNVRIYFLIVLESSVLFVNIVRVLNIFVIAIMLLMLEN